jgi:PhnO protein
MDTAGEIFVRAMQPSDADRVAILAAQLGYKRPEDAIRQWIEKLLPRAGEQAAFVACIEAKVCGWIEISIQYRIQSEPFALIGGLIVDQDVRSRGIGRILCAHAERWSQERNLRMIRVTSRSTRTDAHRFYLSTGFHATKTSAVFEKTLSV